MRSCVIRILVLLRLLFPALASAATPAISLSPSSLTFAGQAIGVTSSAQTVTLTNSGDAPLNTAGIFTTNDFAQTNNCGTSVAAGASCTLSITFTPTATGSTHQISLGANNSLGMKIDGAGYFILDYGNPQFGLGLVYSLNGQFQLDKDGFIVNTSGHKLQGYEFDPLTGQSTGNLQSLNIPLSAKAVATGASTGSGTKGIVAAFNLDSRSIPPSLAFNPADPNTYNYSFATNIYDSNGGTQLLMLFFVMQNVPNQWMVYTSVTDPTTGASFFPSPAPAAGAWMANAILVFDTSGKYSFLFPNLLAPSVLPAGVSAGPLQSTPYISFTPKGAMPETIPFNFTAATQSENDFVDTGWFPFMSIVDWANIHTSTLYAIP